jgi:hypothetical protein
MARSPRADALRLLAQLGGTFDEDCDTLDAPEGMHWADGPHGLALAFTADHWCPPENRKAMRVAVWQDALDRMSYGVVPCTEPDCDACRLTPG